MIPDQTILLDNVIYEVVATVKDEDTGKDYVVFHNKTKKDFTLSCTLYEKENGQIIPIKITEQEDKETALDIINEVMKQLKGK